MRIYILVWGVLLIATVRFGWAEDLVFQSKELNESSGIAQLGNHLWSHNDSGDKPRVFAFGMRGDLRAEVAIAGAEAIDWEDMCSFSRDGKHFIAVGDVGDNEAKRKSVSIYVIEVSPGLINEQPRTFASLSQSAIAILRVTYPDRPVNCEALAYDPLTRSFVLATKETLRCRLFRVDAAILQGEQRVEAELVDTLALPMVTGGDISTDGLRLVLCTYGPGCLIERDAGKAGKPWRTSGENSLKMFELPIRKQGESVCFSSDGKSLYLSSEFTPSPLFCVPLPQE